MLTCIQSSLKPHIPTCAERHDEPRGEAPGDDVGQRGPEDVPHHVLGAGDDRHARHRVAADGAPEQVELGGFQGLVVVHAAGRHHTVGVVVAANREEGGGKGMKRRQRCLARCISGAAHVSQQV